MASTYSDLKIELIGTGEQVGTWGTTTNTNLGTALGEAITGSADVTFSSADVTLTLTNTNASQTARNLRLVCTGTSGGARNLILGSGCQIEKLYLIQNNLADAVTVKNTTGTGVAVPAGGKQFVFNDGTNVVEASSSVINLATQVTGTLPVANGGTGQTSYTNGQLLIGNTTGNTLTKATLTGTANRLTVTDGAGSITLNVDATNANTANKVVARDASGNFSAGTITASLSGNATSATTATNATNVTVTTSNTSSAFKIPFANTTASTTGNYGLLQDSTATFTYNPSTNTVVASTFSGALSGNATTATSAATWTTARTITIGATGKSVNGSADVSWSLSEIGVSTDFGGIGSYAILWYGATNPNTTVDRGSWLTTGTTVAGSSLYRSNVTTLNNQVTPDRRQGVAPYIAGTGATAADSGGGVIVSITSTFATTNMTAASGTWRLMGGNFWCSKVLLSGCVERFYWFPLLWVRIS